jgi:hypothetical protein
MPRSASELNGKNVVASGRSLSDLIVSDEALCVV